MGQKKWEIVAVRFPILEVVSGLAIIHKRNLAKFGYRSVREKS
jgi:hypothetical protein